MRSSQVYVDVNADGRNSDPSFGCRSFSAVIKVGSSSTYSERLGSLTVENYEEDGERIFTLYFEGIPLRRKRFNLKTKEFTDVKLQPEAVIE